jgi:S-adenosylmethionine-dependent methyltransferase
MPNAGTFVDAARRVIDRAESRLVPRDLSARFTVTSPAAAEGLEAAWRKQGLDGAAYESTAAARLQRDRVALIPWLDRTRPLRSSHIVEVGCGRGASTVALSEQGAHVTALDQSAAALTIAELRAAGHNVPVDFLQGDAAELDRLLGDRPVDWIIFWASLEHMTVPERLSALGAAWRTLPADGLLTLVETPNRLWFTDSHTSYLPYFNWLPDELALLYSRFSARPIIRKLADQPGDAALLELRRSGRGVSYHEFDLAIGPVAELEVVSCMQLERRRRNPVRRVGWRLSRAGRYEAMLHAISPEVPSAFLQPFLYLTIRKR